MLLFDSFFPKFCKSDMSMYGYLEVFQRESLGIRDNESRLYFFFLKSIVDQIYPTEVQLNNTNFLRYQSTILLDFIHPYQKVVLSKIYDLILTFILMVISPDYLNAEYIFLEIKEH